eukprot:CAMPEP_0180262990 /NCGR_PEP_ID=MMETSP0987-20121128/45028_1 /TAXON_ID=697907 /ORGANISM="non described non described, Strain CCMP2293" /LENGTH=155 /DNA_ID=CAMNT_0022233161 /DNA_START=56 /DNA_END=520 /DNA_ORIENTATION=+
MRSIVDPFDVRVQMSLPEVLSRVPPPPRQAMGEAAQGQVEPGATLGENVVTVSVSTAVEAQLSYQDALLAQTIAGLWSEAFSKTGVSPASATSPEELLSADEGASAAADGHTWGDASGTRLPSAVGGRRGALRRAVDTSLTSSSALRWTTSTWRS